MIEQMQAKAAEDFASPFKNQLNYLYTNGEANKFSARSISNIRPADKVYLLLRNDVEDTRRTDLLGEYYGDVNAVVIPVRIDTDPYAWVDGSLPATDLWGFYCIENAGVFTDSWTGKRGSKLAGDPESVVFPSEADLLSYIKSSRYDWHYPMGFGKLSCYDAELYDIVEVSLT